MNNINWAAQIQVDSNGWHDVIFHKRYSDNNKIVLVYENCGVPTTIYANIDVVELRNKPVVHKKRIYLILLKGGRFETFRDAQERRKYQSTLKPDSYQLKEIDFEWEL